jgi:hypothetical protein
MPIVENAGLTACLRARLGFSTAPPNGIVAYRRGILGGRAGAALIVPACGILPRRGGRARFKAHAWRACRLERVSGVQIPPSPPPSLAFPPFSGAQREIARVCGTV